MSLPATCKSSALPADTVGESCFCIGCRSRRPSFPRQIRFLGAGLEMGRVGPERCCRPSEPVDSSLTSHSSKPGCLAFWPMVRRETEGVPAVVDTCAPGMTLRQPREETRAQRGAGRGRRPRGTVRARCERIGRPGGLLLLVWE